MKSLLTIIVIFCVAHSFASSEGNCKKSFTILLAQEVYEEDKNIFFETIYSDLEKRRINSEWPWLQLEKLLARPNLNKLAVFAELDSKLVGFMSVHIDKYEDDPSSGERIFLHYIAIHPEYRFKGIARKMILGETGVIYWAKKSGVNRIETRIRESNIDALNFFMKIGFKYKGLDEFGYDNPREPAILLEYTIEDSNQEFDKASIDPDSMEINVIEIKRGQPIKYWTEKR